MKSGLLLEKKEAHCSDGDKAAGRGDCWDITVIDVASRSLLALRHGPRSEANVHAVLADAAERLAPGHTPRLITTDGYAPYVEGVLGVWGREQAPPPPGKHGGRPPLPVIELPPDLVYAQVDKQRDASGNLVKLDTRLVFGTPSQLAERLAASPCSSAVNTSFLERANGTDRNFNRRKMRKTYAFSKAIEPHCATSWLVMATGVFCWVIRTLKAPGQQKPGGTTPAMMLGLTDRPWDIGEFIRLRPVGFCTSTGRQIRLESRRLWYPPPLPERMRSWPSKAVVRKSLKRLGVSARGI